MKKSLFLIMMTAAIFTSCTNELDTEVTNKESIEFDGFVNKSTRSTDLTNESLDAFKVYGFMESAGGVLFNGEEVVKQDGVWTYANKQYWTPGKTYYFSAIAPVADAQWSYDTNNTTDGGILTFENGEGTQDLIYAHTGIIRYNFNNLPPRVGFNFYHLLSRISFNFVNGFENENTKLNITDVKILDAVNKGTVDLAEEAREWQAATTNQLTFGDVKATNSRITRSNNASTPFKYMIPCNKSYKLEFTVSMYQGSELAGTYVHTLSLPEMDFVGNKSYKFQTTLTNKNINPESSLEEIEFELSDVNGWASQFE